MVLRHTNPLKYIYFLESFLVKRLEEKIFINFDKIILFSKNEIKKIDKTFLKRKLLINKLFELLDN